ncbi:Aste57867_21077 [Aphanomyces stellatus]|uniref:Aste57867_21077 protein n=1 Tax=Aphanomyces stellatus TaxID=120398 RepID=A0A485LI14_9STRA|nr:hypothetical protein As57867_021009 [Aphanomyces stellatus]VFT97751.1 Aste57867_21077 [Aphanomyces stellatus]
MEVSRRNSLSQGERVMDVLSSVGLMLLVFDFQCGVYDTHHPLRRVGSHAWDLCPSSYKLLRASMLEVDVLLTPWYTLHGTSRLDTLIRSTNGFRHNVVASHCAFHGNLPALRVLLEKTNHKCTEANLVDWAACNGQLNVIEFLHASTTGTVRCTTWAMDIAATNGHLRVLQWLHANRSEGCTMSAVRGAARHGHLDVLHWLHDTFHTRELWWTSAIDVAAAHGHLAVVQWLHVLRRPSSEKAWVGAAANGHLDVLQWLHANRRAGCTTDAMDEAAANGHLDVVAWLHVNRCEGCTTAAVDGAAQRGHVDVVKYLVTHRKEGYSKASTKEAKMNGHLTVVHVLKANRQLAKQHNDCAIQ